MKRPLYFLLLLTVFLLFFRLGKTTLVNWDEAWLASVASDIASRGAWLKPQWNGEPWFYEPPLLTWVLALVLKLSTSEFSLRAFNVLTGIGTVVLTYLVGERLFRKSWAGIFSVLVLLSNIEFLFRSRQINTDIPLTFFLLLAFYCLSRIKSPQKLIWLSLSALSLGLALLTKRASPFLAFPALGLLLWQQRQKLQARTVALASGVFLLMILPWLGVSFFLYGETFIRQFFFGYTVGKVTSINPATGTSWWFYFESLRHAFKLWFLILPFALGWFVIQFKKNKALFPFLVFPLTFFIVLTLAPLKASWYLIPAYPFLAIITGGFLAHIYTKYKILNTKYLLPLFIVAIFLFQLIQWRDSYIVPETTGHQAKIVRAAKELTSAADSLYLDDDYLPVAVFYSQRHVVPLRFNRELTGDVTPLEIPPESFILSNLQTLKELERRIAFPLTTVNQVGDLLLFRVQKL